MSEENQNPEGGVDDEAAAAEWEASLAAEAEGGTDAAAADGAAVDEDGRVLNQDEIDSLLGFDSAEAGDDANSGIHAILDKSLMAYEKLPMIEVVFDRLVRMMSTSLRNFTSDSVDVSIDSMISMRFDDYLNSIPLPAMLIIYRAVEWENFGLITVDSSQIYSTVDVLLGGRRAQRPIRVEGRPYTTIEQDIVQRMIEVVLHDMSGAFDPISPVTFSFERLEGNPRFATITRPSDAILLVRLRVEMEERGGSIEIVLPHNTLEPIRELLLQMFMGEKFGQDKLWERHLAREVRSVKLDVEAILNEKKMQLNDVLNFKVGSTLLLDCEPDDPVVLKCQGIEVGTGKVGRVGDNVAIRLSDPIRSRPEEPEA